jgi:hypothetical protein
MKKSDFLWMALLPVLTLATCADDESGGKKDSDYLKKPEKATVATVNTDHLICPQVAVLQEAQAIHDYGGDKSDEPGQYAAAARMNKIEGDCGYTEKGIDISFTLHMTAVRGKRPGTSKFAFPYFVAIVDPADNVTRRTLMIAHFHFENGEKNTVNDEPLHVFVPLAKEVVQSGPDYRVLVGFKLPENQIAN